MEFDNKVIVITGGANGIGKQLVLQLLNFGAKVVALDIDEEALKNLEKIAKPKKNFFGVKTDVTDKNFIETLPEIIIKKFKSVDGIINSAGIIHSFVPLNELTYEKIDRIMNINFYGSLFMIKTFLPHLQKETKTFVVNISSMGGFVPFPYQTVYGASKAALKLLTEGLYVENQNKNLIVSCVYPGAVATDIMKNSKVSVVLNESKSKRYSKNILSPEKAATLILKGIKKEKHKIVVGRDAKIMDLLSRFFPNLAMKIICKQSKSFFA